MIFSGGDIYEGMLENDTMHGNGKEIYSGGGIYEGMMENDKRHGNGKRI